MTVTLPEADEGVVLVPAARFICFFFQGLYYSIRVYRD